MFLKVDIVTLTSPSAARAWVAKTGNLQLVDDDLSFLCFSFLTYCRCFHSSGSDYDAIVIGPTTFKAAKSLGTHFGELTSYIECAVSAVIYAPQKFVHFVNLCNLIVLQDLIQLRVYPIKLDAYKEWQRVLKNCCF